MDADEKRSLAKTARELHNLIRDLLKLTEEKKPILVGGILVALHNPDYPVGYQDASTSGDIFTLTLRCFEWALVARTGLTVEAVRERTPIFHSLASHPEVIRPQEQGGQLRTIVDTIADKVYPLVEEHGGDILSPFYQEFLSYAGADQKALGVVLTPEHICELMVEMVNIQPHDRVVDLCCGTGRFLIEALKAGAHEVMGIEQQPHIAELCFLNMVLAGAGSSHLRNADCFLQKEAIHAFRSTVGLINPPYRQKAEGLHELDYVRFLLDSLCLGGRAAVILPRSCCFTSNPNDRTLNEKKADILSRHRLDAVCSLPDDLFYPVQASPCVMVFKAHHPHGGEHRTWLADWRDDGFYKTAEGRVDPGNFWEEVCRDYWLKLYRSRAQFPSECGLFTLGAETEWCPEAWLETNYGELYYDDLNCALQELWLFCAAAQLKHGLAAPTFDTSVSKAKKTLPDVEEWQSFPYEQIFRIIRGQGNIPTQPGDTPFISCTIQNNGVAGYYDAPARFDAGCITLTAKSEAFYQPFAFAAGSNVKVLQPRFPMTPWRGIFLATLIGLEKFRYSFGRVLSATRLRSATIRLPVTNEGKPDWETIDGFMATLPMAVMMGWNLSRLENLIQMYRDKEEGDGVHASSLDGA